jgi:hypothetical protein
VQSNAPMYEGVSLIDWPFANLDDQAGRVKILHPT